MDKKYNIVFYFSDQQRADTCGCYGQKLDITPNLDRFAQEGVLFENAFTPQPVCGPCRAIFQTGLYATSTGCFRNNKMLPINFKTVANYMEGAGYETAYVGKWHLASEGALESKPVIDYQTKAIPPELRGGYTGFWRASDVLEFTSDGEGGFVFDENMQKHEFKGYRCSCITDYALEFLEQYKKDKHKPFFLTVSHIEPHHQNNANHYQGPAGSKEKYKNFIPPEDLKAISGGDWQEEYPDYLGACNSVDENFGRIIAKLKEIGVYDDTVIIYTSDHGSHFRTRNKDANLNGHDDYKRTCHESAIHIPLVISGGPFKCKGKRIKELVSTVSIPKTVVTLAGLDVDNYMEGERLQDLAAGKTDKLKDGEPKGWHARKNEVFLQISESRVGRCIRTPDWKYSVVAPNLNGGEKGGSDYYVDDFLYDLKSDPYELTNLAHNKDYVNIKSELRKKLIGWIKDVEGLEVNIGD
ncbi:sulfatase-like hydrolase/transferase [Treponema parvum]|uniref:Sulfatase-like hydrolase/transferase n=1 Tax=Treponema parvum TaxID=138851 RepID=A0A975F279_9SPIR|nr:sulfatase-like hydrolase/transferase [Treponema parvum]QTQ13144.1 sulfatase-like hydrolase/transferase [Treponema parvum]